MALQKGIEKKEIIETLTSWGVRVGVNTLKEWERVGAIAPALYRNSRKTIYPEYALLEAYRNCLLRERGYIREKQDIARLRKKLKKPYKSKTDVEKRWDLRDG